MEVGVGTILTLDTLASALTAGGGAGQNTTLDTLGAAALNSGTRDTRALTGTLAGDAAGTLLATEGRAAPPASTMVARTLLLPASRTSLPGTVFFTGLVFCGVPQGEAVGPTLSSPSTPTPPLPSHFSSAPPTCTASSLSTAVPPPSPPPSSCLASPSPIGLGLEDGVVLGCLTGFGCLEGIWCLVGLD